MHFISICPIDRTRAGATNPGQIGAVSDGNEWMFCIPPISSITRASPSDCLLSYTGHSLGESFPSAEVQSVYSTAQANREISSE